MTATTSRRLGQTAAVALLAVLILSVGLLGIVPAYETLQNLRSQIDQERLILGRLSTLRSDDREVLEIKRSTEVLQATKLTLDGETDPVRLANLQLLSNSIAATRGVQVRSTRNLPLRELTDVRLLGIQLQFAATYEQLLSILLAIEGQNPYLLVDGLQITPSPDTTSAGRSGDVLLEARLDVYGATTRSKELAPP